MITGEGRIDAQTAFGKTALGVARRAAGAGVPCIAVGGGVSPTGSRRWRPLGAVAVPVAERPNPWRRRWPPGDGSDRACGERLARLRRYLAAP